MESAPVTVAYVDLSLFARDSSVGHICGNMSVPLPLTEGERVAFGDAGREEIRSALGDVRIEKILNHNGSPLLALSNVFVGSTEEAFNVMHYLEERFGLMANVHDEDDFRRYIQHSRREDHQP
ncbi:hypothetical protein [Novosphingobium sp.]|uniref:hypothetical protein n=1 Tax=Novosphingobium sp. TaxID=1874826 RepID=UPI00261A0457|nr:hypothetical protein [Novosphingobium sp.]HQS70049.1 hypothetical protein [Novosphingobium sp.]